MSRPARRRPPAVVPGWLGNMKEGLGAPVMLAVCIACDILMRPSVAGGSTYDPSAIGDFSTVPQRGWCPYL